MDRREAIKSFLAGIGVPAATVDEVEKADRFYVMNLPEHYMEPDAETLLRIRDSWRAVFNGRPPGPILVMPPGVTLQAFDMPK